MKHIKSILIVICIFNLQCAFCDVIPENTHFVEKCVKITNISDYANVTLLGYIVSISMQNNSTYIINPSDCLTKGYKFNSLDVFAVSSNYLADKNIDEIDLPNDAQALKASVNIEPYEDYYHDSIPINRIEEYYKILGFSDTTVVLFKWKEVFGFNDGTTDSVNTYNYTGDISSLEQKIPTESGNPDILSSIILYPNPSETVIKAEISNSFIGLIDIQLISSDGKLLFNSQFLKNYEQIVTDIPIHNFAEGTYFVRIKLGNTIETKKIVIR